VKITAVTQQVKRPDRYSVFIDGSFAFGASQDAILKHGFIVGQQLTAEEVADLEAEIDQDNLYQKTLDLIARRPRSEWEITFYLKRKEATPTVTAKIIAQLKERTFIDDEDFARRWIENRHLLKPTSRKKLRLELMQKRVSGHIIDAVLGQDQTDEYEVLKELIGKKRTQSRFQDDLKLIQYLARQGYRYDDIKRALAEEAS
jgi:regulatory protein